jgi:tRNA(Ile)-lysidine synthase
LWEDAAVIGDARVAVPVGPTRDTSARLVARAIAILGGEISHGEVAAFLKAADRRGNIAGVLVERRGDRFICTPEPPRRSG